ncbi:MAG: dynamin family protein [Porphyromonas sp.]|jgi:putative atp /gtp binding protein|nr:dynamin family protein [Porphyromonas sp.]
MEIKYIIYIAIALFLGLILGFLLNRKKSDSDKTQLESKHKELDESVKEPLRSTVDRLEAENKELKHKLSEALTSRTTDLSSDSEDRVRAIESKYKALLEEANQQCSQLDQQLKDAVRGEASISSAQEQSALVAELKKKISNLEDEIEDLEDDISEWKGKVSSKEQECDELNKKSEEQRKKFEEKINDVRDSLKVKEEELNCKMESLNFIQEILSAKELSSDDVNKLYKRIGAFESFVKGPYLDLNAHLYSNYNSLTWDDKSGSEALQEKKKWVMDNCDQWVASKRKSWLDKKTTIAFVGEFSAGKTSIVNRILSQDNPNIPKLPVSTKATTAIPTYIAGGNAVSYSFISGDGQRKEILEDTFKKVSKEILDQVKGVSSLIKYFVMTYQNKNLNGISILDTPGFSSNDSEDRERTIDVINECDALFWVFDVNAGTINRSSISVIKEKLNKPLYIVINKVDTKPESEIRKVEQLIKSTLAEAGLQVEQFIRFSSKSPLENIMAPIRNVPRSESREAFVADIHNDLKGFLNVFDEAIKTSTQDLGEKTKAINGIKDDIVEGIKDLKDECDKLTRIPTYETHFFGSDKYEMSESKFSKFLELIDRISGERINYIIGKVDESLDATAEIETEYSWQSSLQSSFRNIDDCWESYEKIMKELKRS